MENRNEKIKQHVKKHYAEVAKGSSCCEASSCCSPNSITSYAKTIGYSNEELKDLPDSAITPMAGCGNPTALASLKEGEVVLDLGSGGGIDAFLAAKKVGPKGKIIGVDMTEEMIQLAKENAEKLKTENVEFRLGEIENLPVEDGIVDVILSNCVINLSPDKDKVFTEAFRVLKPGGRLLISDIVTQGELPNEIRENVEMWAACVAGALDEKDYLQKIRNAGFQKVEVVTKNDFMEIVSSIKVRAYKPS
ncbi:MAG: arsenite methyltransferase [Candidatus Bathyarchaeota archaeon]|nr:MAG: arsenite methyltransferase [Candidatus Bathyarchaeota archaeon]